MNAWNWPDDDATDVYSQRRVPKLRGGRRTTLAEVRGGKHRGWACICVHGCSSTTTAVVYGFVYTSLVVFFMPLDRM